MPNKCTRTQTEAQERSRVSLSTIIAATRRSIEAIRARRKALEAEAVAAPPVPSWTRAFEGQEVAVIAEIKRRSPSLGEIARTLDPTAHATAYERGGARAISVLTEGLHFGGSLQDLDLVRHAVALPVLRKDFIIDPVQVFETRAAGASALLLIARAMRPNELRELAELARGVGLGVLVEIHRAAELDAALSSEPDAIGVNSRDLETFVVDLTVGEALLRQIPADITAVAESGLHSKADVQRAASWGTDGVLVGAALASAADPESAVRNLAGCSRSPGVRSVR
jgi:indole-3-glycerol phosphate synthase